MILSGSFAAQRTFITKGCVQMDHETALSLGLIRLPDVYNAIKILRTCSDAALCERYWYMNCYTGLPLHLQTTGKYALLLQYILKFSRLMIYIYICRTAPLTSRCYILYIYSTNIRTEYFKHTAHSPFFPLENAVYFIMLPFFGSCIIHILNTGCAKI